MGKRRHNSINTTRNPANKPTAILISNKFSNGRLSGENTGTTIRYLLIQIPRLIPIASMHMATNERLTTANNNVPNGTKKQPAIMVQ